MKERILTGVVLAVLLIPLLFVSAIYFYAFIGVLVALSARELVNMVVTEHPQRVFATAYTGGFSLILFVSMLLAYKSHLDAMWVFAFLFAALITGVTLVVFSVFNYEHFTRFFLSVMYIGMTFFAVALLRSIGLHVLIYLLILSMVTDIFAYFVGVRFGKHKLAPLISPKKTIEGFFGGTFIAALFAAAFAYGFDLFSITGFIPALLVFFIGWFVAMSAQVGDLFASSMKRLYGIKDFSKLLPGHGGVLDRLDSTIFAAIVLVVALFIYGGI